MKDIFKKFNSQEELERVVRVIEQNTNYNMVKVLLKRNKMKNLKVKKLFNGFIPLRDKYLEVQDDLNILVQETGENFYYPQDRIKNSVAYMSKETFRDKFSNETHKIAYLKPAKQQANTLF